MSVLLSMMKGAVDFKGLCFRFNKETSLNIIQTGSPQRTIKYSYNGRNWGTLLDTQNNISNTITVPANRNLYLKGNCISQSNNNYITFNTSTSNTTLTMSGNINSLLTEDNFNTEDISSFSGYMFFRIFRHSNIFEIYADDLQLPATKLCDNCYREMFKFANIISAKFELPADILKSACYYAMFEDCTKLIYGPTELPAMNLATDCYRAMFNVCSQMEVLPYLPATTLQFNCYRYMFNSCSAAKYLKIAYTGNFDINYFNTWVGGSFSPSGDLYYNGTDTTIGINAIPSGWTVHAF